MPVKTKPSMKIEVLPSSQPGMFYFHIKARNGEILAHSQNYTTKRAANATARSLIKNLSAATIIDLTKEAKK